MKENSFQLFDNKLFRQPLAIVKAMNSQECHQAFQLITNYARTNYVLGYVG